MNCLASQQVVQLLQALVVPSQKVLAADARIVDHGGDNPVLILDRLAMSPLPAFHRLALGSLGLSRRPRRNIEEAEQELREALIMLRTHHDAGTLSTPPAKIMARLEKEHAYCSDLIKQLATCKSLAARHAWEKLAIHCDELLHSPDNRSCTTHGISSMFFWRELLLAT